MKVAIIGGSGKMGQWLARQLIKAGYYVVITGRNKKKLEAARWELGVATATNIQAVKTADVVVLSVPPDNFEATVKQIHRHLRPEQIIFDITSTKAAPVAIMHQYFQRALVLGTHPMFGPGAKDIAGQNLILTPTNKRETMLAKKLKTYLEAEGAKVALMSPAEHDQMMAIVLGLTHFIALVAADTLVSCDNLKAAKTVSGSSYKVLLTLIGSVVSEDPEFYASLQTSLPGMDKITGTLEEKVRAWAGLVKRKDRPEFTRRMMALKEALEKSGVDLAKAYRDMYRIVDSP